MIHCEAIDIETTPTGAIFRGSRWPEEIEVDRNLLDYLPGPHVSFGRFGVLRFQAINGYAVYRRFEDRPGGWNYRLVEHQLTAAAPVATAAEPAAHKADAQYLDKYGKHKVDAFQWLPHAVPPVQLPEWFMRSDFEHKASGELTIRSGGHAMKAAPDDWIVRKGVELHVMKPEAFATEYVPLALLDSLNGMVPA